MSNMEDYKRVLLGESYQSKKETLEEAYDAEYDAIMETIDDLAEAEAELDEWIEDFEEGARAEHAKYVVTGGPAGKYGAISNYKKARKAGDSRLKSAGKGLMSGTNQAKKGFSKDRSKELTKKADEMKPSTAKGSQRSNDKTNVKQAKTRLQAARHKLASR